MNGHTQTSRRSLRGRLSSERGRTTVGMLAAFGLTAVIWTAALAVFGFYPFGGKSILITDLNQQYVEFHAALYDMVNPGSSLLFTWDTGLGMNFLGLLAYYLASPFTLLLFCFPRAMLTEAILFIISMKLAASALTFSLWLAQAPRHWRRGQPAVRRPVRGWAGYGVTYCFNLMWLDGMVLLPLVALAARRVFDKGRIGAFTAALTVLFLANFYIAYVVGIFTFLLYLGWLLACREDRRPVRRLGAFFAGTALAAGLATFLLLPTLSALLGGYENVHGFSLSLSGGANPLRCWARWVGGVRLGHQLGHAHPVRRGADDGAAALMVHPPFHPAAGKIRGGRSAGRDAAEPTAVRFGSGLECVPARPTGSPTGTPLSFFSS